MFTSRAEYRLILREDNADLRLRPKGYDAGLVQREDYERFLKKKKDIDNEMQRLRSIRLRPDEPTNQTLLALGTSTIKTVTSLEDLLRRPDVTYETISGLGHSASEDISSSVKEQVEIQTKYHGYIERQEQQVQKFKKLEQVRIPSDFDYTAIPSLSHEVREKLSTVRPSSLGQASRISGITPAALAVILMYLKRSEPVVEG